jgi:cell division protein FtsI (penicillin-binding protein 3)
VNTQNSEIDGWSITTAKEQYVQMKSVQPEQDKMPDVRGMGARDAMYVLEKAGIKNIKVTGKGTVKQQSVAPGTPVGSIHLVALELS